MQEELNSYYNKTSTLPKHLQGNMVHTFRLKIRLADLKELLTAEERAAYEAEPIVLAPWDPMGALAE